MPHTESVTISAMRVSGVAIFLLCQCLAGAETSGTLADLARTYLLDLIRLNTTKTAF